MLNKILILFICLISFQANAQHHSVAREWNEVLLQAIREDFARPTVHARNLFHTSAVMYDAWAAFDTTKASSTYFLGKTLNGFECSFDKESFKGIEDIEAARAAAISYAAFSLLKQRFRTSPGRGASIPRFDSLMTALGYDTELTTIVYTPTMPGALGNPAALGNYLATCMMEYGLQDGSNEAGGFSNTFYEPVNEAFSPFSPGNPEITDPNRWQPMFLDVRIDQSGNPQVSGLTPSLSPEWGRTHPFSLSSTDLNVYQRDGLRIITAGVTKWW